MLFEDGASLHAAQEGDGGASITRASGSASCWSPSRLWMFDQHVAQTVDEEWLPGALSSAVMKNDPTLRTQLVGG